MLPEIYIRPNSDGIIDADCGGPEPDWNSPVTLLIHGYNTHPAGAKKAFLSLIETMKRNQVLPIMLESQSWLVFWEAYVNGGLATGKTLTSPLSYARQIPSAMIAAAVLKRFLDQSNGRAQVNIIAHSLGCRLVMELLESYAGPSLLPKPKFLKVILMAPAVPVFFLSQLKRLWRAPRMPDSITVLCSTSDRALGIPFRVGQSIAQEGVFPEAIGRRGLPRESWGLCKPTKNDHSDYFEDKTTAEVIGRAFGKVVPGSLPESRIAAREGMNESRLAAARLPSRSLGGAGSHRA